MSEYLGTLGSLINLPYKADESVSYANDGSSVTTLGGTRYVSRPARKHRSWKRDVSLLEASEVGKLVEFSLGAYGPGPHHWVSISAARGNVLTPRESMCLDYRQAALVSAGGPAGGAGQSLLTTGGINDTLWPGIPVVPGQPLTASVMSWGAGALLRILDAMGGLMENRILPVGDGSVTIPNVPVGAHQAVILSQPDTTRVARPQVTYNSKRVPWAVGDGCRQAIVHVPDVSTILAIQNQPMHQSVSMSIEEVGLP